MILLIDLIASLAFLYIIVCFLIAIYITFIIPTKKILKEFEEELLNKYGIEKE
ncbi:hypothetical protein [Clostridium gasigenes]|uniref:hypothetical protein n=1 Tax=Clostridium gasigenes TaxID=94869 RepID=UPI001C0C8D63|nr:hypothetical protein [Clostridium gasigenes]MBU3106708.1 hypothetical protein [Clostridium gasigenes]